MTQPPMLPGPGQTPPWMMLPMPGAPNAQTLYRAISVEENTARGRVLYGVALGFQFLVVVLPTVAGMLLLLTLLFMRELNGYGWLIPLTTLGVFAVAYAIGAPLGFALSGSRAEAELSPGRVLVTAWNETGFSVPSKHGQRQIPFSDVRAVRRAGTNGWFVVLRLPIQWLATEPNFVSLPQDLVPEWALQRLGSGGAA